MLEYALNHLVARGLVPFKITEDADIGSIAPASEGVN